MLNTRLPIDAALPALRDALRAGTSAVLQAPPGAGKSTRVPLELLGERWLGRRKIIMLEPRRLAARAAAARMASTLEERVGDTVGYRMRMDTRVGTSTRIEVVTEGVLTRMLQHDPSLDDVGLVIFDEFHERNLVADIGLALTLQSRAILRDDATDPLRVLVMSATLDGARIAELLGGAAVITSEGRAFSVETRYTDRPRAEHARLEPVIAATVRDALARDEGDVLVFLPGAGEIRRVAAMLRESVGAHVAIAQLFGNLPQDEQDRAIAPSAPGGRKVVLATSIAETSLTIEGVRVVIDSGLSRVPRFSPRSGMTRLATVRVSRASADQRRRRAGRVAPGVCYRLWPEHEQHHLVSHATPEILEADLAPLALDLAAAGVREPADLRWLDPPPAAAFAQARELLVELGALDAGGRITALGEHMSRLPLHPRLARMVLRALAPGGEPALALVCNLAAVLDERDLLRGDGAPPDADVGLRLEILSGADDRASPVPGHSIDRDAVRRVRTAARELLRIVAPRENNSSEFPGSSFSTGLLLAFAYPDRIGQRREGGGAGRYLLRNGLGAAFGEPQALSDAPYLVAAELDGKRPESRIFLAARVSLEELETHFAPQIEREDVVDWDDATRAVAARRRVRLGALVLRESALRDADPDAVAAALAAGIARAGVAALPWSDAARGVRERLAFLRHHDASWPDVSDDTLAATMDEWLTPHLRGVRRLDDVRRADLSEALLGRLTWRQRAALDELAPTHVAVPSGSRVAIDYAQAAAPVLAVRLQEMFGLADTPRIAGGAVALTLHLLSPARRPVQVTRDLAGFWRDTYFEVRKDLRGRYPKHAWPDDPMSATATRGTKRK
ncbi:MAG: ATP-dependent helicase HrpB [Gemmatimonadaceae bacterium]